MEQVKEKQQQTKSAPLLDNIETTDFQKTSENSIIINDFCTSDVENLYSKTSKNNNSETIISELKRYKGMSVELASTLIYYDSILQDRAEKIMSCGNYVEIAVDDEGAKIATSSFCRQRICPSCQKRRSLRVASDILRIQNAMPDYEWLHIVLTVPNVIGDNLSKTVDELYKKSSELFRDKRIKQGFKGVLRALEVSYNNSRELTSLYDDSESITTIDGDCWHPHLHCLVAVKKSYFTSRYYINKDLLMWKWVYYWGSDRLLQVNMSRVRDSGAVAEVAKYCVKPLEFTVPDWKRPQIIEHLFSCLYGRRLLQTYGVVKETARAVKIDLNADDFKFDKGARVDRYWYNWKNREYIYSDTELL